jgi:hypothetical protein
MDAFAISPAPGGKHDEGKWKDNDFFLFWEFLEVRTPYSIWNYVYSILVRSSRFQGEFC